jgi:hypothetical protein
VPATEKHPHWHSGQIVQSWFHQTRHSYFSWSKSH